MQRQSTINERKSADEEVVKNRVLYKNSTNEQETTLAKSSYV
jgi:hypothetical protein